MFGSIFKKLTGNAQALANSALGSSDKDVMEAMMASCALVAYADGDVSDEEIAQTIAQIEGSDQLAGMADEAKEVFMKYVKRLETTGRMAKMELMKEIGDITSDITDDNRIRVVIMGIEVADAENGIDDTEMKVLEQIAKKLDVNLS